MPLGEPASWQAARKARLAQQFPVEFGNADAATVMGVDSMRVSQGQPPSQFSQMAMRLAAAAAQQVNQPKSKALDVPPEALNQ